MLIFYRVTFSHHNFWVVLNGCGWRGVSEVYWLISWVSGLDIGYPVQICEKNPMGNSYATWQLGYPHCVSWNLLHRSIGSSVKNLCRLLKNLMPFATWSWKVTFCCFPFAVHVFFLNVVFLSCLSSFFSSPKKNWPEKSILGMYINCYHIIPFFRLPPWGQQKILGHETWHLRCEHHFHKSRNA